MVDPHNFVETSHYQVFCLSGIQTQKLMMIITNARTTFNQALQVITLLGLVGPSTTQQHGQGGRPRVNSRRGIQFVSSN